MEVFVGSLILAGAHGLMPDHWIPLVMISRTEKWSRMETSWVTALIAIPHIISTILIGIILDVIGHTLSSTHEFIMRTTAPLILVALGVFYVVLDFRGFSRHNHQNFTKIDASSGKSKFAIITSLGTALFFPCVAIGAYYLIAGAFGWLGIALVSIIYLIVTILVMVLVVNLGLKGVEKIKWHFLKHHDRSVMGDSIGYSRHIDSFHRDMNWTL
ncbi:MAG: hypothetical protein DRN29_10785 [Thermoplasmata archaeon]|nr:MAG: hypothetical protein DRN29_10785 [Thermoplasmata archaeon]